MFDLLSTSCYLDFNILNYLIKKRKPQLNSGQKLPINQALLRGNPLLIEAVVEQGKINPYVSDLNGKCPIHIAAAKLDLDSFDLLID